MGKMTNFLHQEAQHHLSSFNQMIRTTKDHAEYFGNQFRSITPNTKFYLSMDKPVTRVPSACYTGNEILIEFDDTTIKFI